MKALLDHFRSPQRPMRVGRLITGELILIDHLDRVQVHSTETTELIREALAANDAFAPTQPAPADETPLPAIEGLPVEAGVAMFARAPEGSAVDLRDFDQLMEVSNAARR